jgi:endogenous inhibitor of DNA gyrase (YacG/DUF329 family)
MSKPYYMADGVYRCPACGKFVNADSDAAFFDSAERLPEDRSPDWEPHTIAAFCDEQCAVAYHGSSRHPDSDSHKE